MLRKRWKTILLNLLEEKISPQFFRHIKNSCYRDYNDGFYVRAKMNEFPDSKKGLEYVLRYCGRPCFAQYRIIDIKDDFITFCTNAMEMILLLLKKFISLNLLLD